MAGVSYREIRWVTSLFFVMLYFSGLTAQAQYGGDSGEPNDPYQIATAEDLMLLGQSPEDYDKHFILTADINLDPNLPGRKVFDRAVIAPDTNEVKNEFQGTSFTGVFDGNGHKISNLTITGGWYLGLFGQLGFGAKISNLALKDVDIKGTGAAVGGLVGFNHGSIATSYSTGTVSGSGSEYWGIGSFAGTNTGSIIASYSAGSVNGDRSVGGLVGRNVGSITTSYSTATVGGNEYVGGLVGDNPGGSITASFWNMESSGQTTSAGGTGLTTAEMQEIDTYINAGWDFVDEILNGTCDYWQISPGDYPQLRYHTGDSPLMPEGSGTTEQPYLIRDARDLGTVWLKPSAHYRLGASVDLSGITWSMAVIPWFEGTFNGNGHVISNLHIQGGGHLGLFGQLVSEAKISDLGLEEVDVSGTGRYVGGLVGVIGSLREKSVVLTNCYSAGTVTGGKKVGGLVGYNFYGIIITSHNTCTVSGIYEVGGLLGSHGGLEGTVGGVLTNSYSTGMTSGESGVGGLVGVNGGIITTSHSTGTVNGTGAYVGGLVGDDYGIITTSHSTGEVTGNRYVGGLVGKSYGSIASSYSTGTVSGNEYVGGLAGHHFFGSITASFWDIESSGQATSAGGTGLTTAEMQEIDTYLNAGWDFIDEIFNGTCDYWQMSPGDYPRLIYITGNGPVMPEGSGMTNEPYLIRDARDLGTVWLEPTAHYCLEASVDLTGITWYMAVVPWFGGTFDGKGHVISNLHIQGIEYLGLFGHLGSQAKISNLGLEVMDVNGTGGYVGGLAGESYGSITKSYSSGTVNGTRSRVGALVGENHGSITTSRSTGMVTGFGDVGGLVGYNGSGDISTSYSTGSVSGSLFVGGLVGVNDNNSNVTNCYSTCSVSGNGLVGGLVSYNSFGIITSSFWDVETSGLLNSDGGIGKTTDEMQTATTFLEAGWDFVDETANGTEDIWWIDEGQDYPRLWWEFTEADFIVVDDFESYNDLDPDDPNSNRIFNTWMDGYVDPNNGSLVDIFDWFAPWREIVAHGGARSMWYFYDNNFKHSEVTVNIADLVIDRNWTIEGVEVLSLWFNGDPANAPEPMYVGIANANGPTAVVYHDNPDAILINDWTQWRIDLQNFADKGVDLTNVGSISIGFGDKNNPQPSGSGLVFFDDIRLYRPTPEPEAN